VQKHKIKIKHPSILYSTMKMQLEERQTRIEIQIKMNNNVMVSFQFLQGINTKSLARSRIWKITQNRNKIALQE